MENVQQSSDRFVEVVRLVLCSFAAVAAVWMLLRFVFGLLSKRLPAAGKVVLVTGCDTPLGFGTAIARKLHQLGYIVFAGCLHADESSDTVHSDLMNSKRFQVVQLDVTDQAQVDNCVEVVSKWLQGNPGCHFHSVVNNAGICLFGPLEWFKMATFTKIFDVNCFGMVRVTQAFLPLIRNSSSEGRVVVIASNAGDMSVPYSTAYCGSKAASLMISNCLRVEVADQNVKVSSICPDFFRTNLISSETLLATMKHQFGWVDKETYEPYGGDSLLHLLTEVFTEGLMRFSKSDVSPVVECAVDAVASLNPKRNYQCIAASTAFSKFLYHYFPRLYDGMCLFTLKVMRRIKLGGRIGQ